MRLSNALYPLLSVVAVASPHERRQFGGGGSGGGGGGNVIEVNLGQRYQTMDGFGASEAFQRAVTMQKLPEDQQRRFLDLMFHRTKGAGLSILRNGIGSSPDMRDDHMVSIQPRNPGGPGAKPAYDWDGSDNGQLWVSKEAVHTYGLKTIYANAWSAPGYMKTNGNDANGGNLCGVPGANCQSGDWKQAYADYLVAYIKFYEAENITITNLGFLNEPDLSTSYASMQSNGAQAASIIQVLRPTLDAAGLEHIDINCCDTMGYGVMNQFLGSMRGVESMMGVVTGHSYTSSPTSPLQTRLRTWQTEAADNNGGWTNAWFQGGGAGEGMTFANQIHTAVTSGNVSAWLYWIGAQDRSSNTNSKMIRVVNNRQVDPSKRLWAMANWSRFVRPGAVRVGTSGGQGVRHSAFVNEDGKLAVQILNGGGAGTFTISVSGAADFNYLPANATAWITDNDNDCTGFLPKVDGDGRATGDVPARSMVTFLLEPAVEAPDKAVEETAEESTEGSAEEDSEEDPEETPSEPSEEQSVADRRI